MNAAVQDVVSLRPFLAVGIGFAAAVLILLSSRRPKLRETWTFLAAVGQLVVAVSMIPAALLGEELVTPALGFLPGAPIQFRADPLGVLFLTLSSLLWVVTSLYSVSYLEALAMRHRTGYFAAFAASVASAAGIALAANPLTFLICFEALTLATWPLVIHKRTEKVLGSGRTYLAYTLFAGQLLFAAVVWTAWLAPGVGFTPGGFLAGLAGDGALRGLFALFLVGVGVKAAVLPLHAWLPAAMVAPSPVSALLHAVAVVKAGAFGVLRLTGWVFGPDLMRELDLDWPLALLAGATILFASLRALGEDHLKRRLAYSTVSQLSYIVLGAAIGTPLALAGAAFHIVAHGFTKISLFLSAGVIQVAAGKERISELRGLGRRLPFVFVCIGLGGLGMAGVPLLPGFVSKWNLALGGLAVGEVWVVVLLVASGLLNLAYYFPIVRTAVFEPGHPGAVARPPNLLQQPPLFAILFAVALGVWPNAGLMFWNLAQLAAMYVGAGAAELTAALPGAGP